MSIDLSLLKVIKGAFRSEDPAQCLSLLRSSFADQAIPTFECIHYLAEQAIAKVSILPPDSPQRNQAKAFLSRLKQFNQIIKSEGLSERIQQLSASLFPPKNSKVNSLVANFEHRTVEVLPSPAPRVQNSLPVSKIFAPKDPWASFQAKIQALDPQGLNLAQEVEELKKEVEKLFALEQLTAKKKYRILAALDSLINPTLYEASDFEKVTLNLLTEKYPQLEEGMHKFKEVEQASIQEARSRIMKILKGNHSTPKALASAIKGEFNRLKKELILFRFRSLPHQPFNEHFARNLPSLVEAMETFSFDALSQFEHAWDTILQGFENEFVTFFKQNYPAINLTTYFPELLKLAQKKYLTAFTLEMLSQENPDVISKRAASIQEKAKKEAKKILEQTYRVDIQERVLWLSRNYRHITRPYDQTTSIHINLGDGTCYQDSLDREALLIKHPHIPGKEVPFGSVQKGRFAQTKYQLENRERKGMSAEEFDQMEASSAKRVGLKRISAHPLPMNPQEPPLMSLVQGIDEAYQKGGGKLRTILILYIASEAHALNIQLDHSKKIYRFLDSNLGACEFESYEQFITEFPVYLQSYDWAFNLFVFETYTPIPKQSGSPIAGVSILGTPSPQPS